MTYEGKVLQKDKDYSVEYMDNTEAGTASVIITGIEDYAGSLTMDFLIIRRESDNSITASDRYASYSSKPQNVRLGACAKGGTLTYQSSKVEVTPEGIVKLPGEFTESAEIHITAKDEEGNFKTAEKIVRVIVPSAPALSSKEVKNSAFKKITVTWKKVSGISGYELQYAKNKQFSSGAKTVKVKKSAVSKTISGLKKGNTYYVRMRSYKIASGITYTWAWSKTVKVKVKK